MISNKGEFIYTTLGSNFVYNGEVYEIRKVPKIASMTTQTQPSEGGLTRTEEVQLPQTDNTNESSNNEMHQPAGNKGMRK